MESARQSKLNANKTRSQREVHNAEARILKSIHDEGERRGNFLRIFPTASTWELYGQYLDARPSFNSVLHKALFPSVCKFTFTDVYKGSKALYSCLKSKNHSCQCHSGKLKFAKKLVNSVQAFGKLDYRRSKSVSRVSSSTSAGKFMKSNQLETNTTTVEGADREHDNCLVIRLLRMDETLSQVQARQAFALYLYRVGQKLDTVMSNVSVQHSPRSSVNFQQQLEMVLQFLQYASTNLLDPMTIEPPDVEQKVCDQGRHLLSEMDRFLEAYEDETECMWQAAGSDEREYFVDTQIFQSFLETAKASELEEVLMIVAEHHSTSWFIGSSHGNDLQMEPPLVTNYNNGLSLEGLCCIKPEFFPQQSNSTQGSSSLTDFTAEDEDTGHDGKTSANHGQSYSRHVIKNRVSSVDNTVTSSSSSSLSSFHKLCKAARIYTS